MKDEYYLSRGRIRENSLAYYDENLNEISEFREEILTKIRGSIVDKSLTGGTLFVEPLSVAKYYEKLQLLKIDEENEVYRILYTLSTHVLASAPILYEDLKLIEKLDFIFSKGKLSLDMDVVPLQFDIGEDVRGLVTSADYEIYAAPSVGLPAPECMMVKELVEVALEHIKGSVEYTFYEQLR